jgi:pimeloyl-ACP methyl ester carboxylesterase
MWSYVEEHLYGSFDVITPDLPGFGSSSALAGPYTFARYARELRTLIKDYELQNVVLVGFAFGAAVALSAAAESSSDISAVISVGMPDPAASPYEKMPKSMRRDWPEFARRSAHALFNNKQSEATIGWLERIFGNAALPVAIETVGELALLDAPVLAAKADVKQHFIHARQDLVAPVAFGERCSAAAKDGTIVTIEDCGHLIVLDNKGLFQEHLDSLLSGISK